MNWLYSRDWYAELIPVLNHQTPGDGRRASITSASSYGVGSDDPRARYPSTGNKLLAAFALTDCLQILSNNQYFIFDPCGRYIITEENVTVPGGEDSHHAQAKAQRCDISEREIASRFPDQFKPFFDAGRDVTVIRIPLRTTAESSISSTCCGLVAIRKSIDIFTKHCAEGIQV